MALQSQSPRTAINRRYPMTTKRKKGLAPWMVLAGVAIIIGGLVVLFYSGDTPTNAAGDDNDNKDTDTAQAGVGGGDRDRTAGKQKAPEVPDDHRRTPTKKIDSSLVDTQLKEGVSLLDKGDYVNGRRLLSGLLFQDGALAFSEKKAICERLEHLNDKYVFSTGNRKRAVAKADPILDLYNVRSGDNPTKIGMTYRIPSKLVMRINGIKDARSMRADQPVQVIRGPIHARVVKSEYRMYLFVEDRDGEPIFLKWFPVGLGESDSTPLGTWRLKKNGKVGPENGGPGWSNPRAKPGEKKYYKPTDKDNPLGEYWIGLEGTDGKTSKKQSYGIHATIEPDSIGQQESMGCVRMRDKDVDEVFYSLYEVVSTVEIVR